MRAGPAVALWGSLAAAAFGLFAACDGADPPNQFTTGSFSAGPGTGGSGGGEGVDPELGGPCVEDSQCDDGVSCTFDRCDQDFARCRFTRDDTVCDNGVYCDGAEVCDQKLDCVPGIAPSCTDGDVCTIDACVEESQSCVHAPRDADGDGDPDAHCGGGDCADDDPEISSLVEEVCGNAADDDCDGQTDEDGCASPANDTCTEALLVTGTGTYAMSTTGASSDYPTSCTPMGVVRDVVAEIRIPAGPPIDVIVRARTQSVPVSLALAGLCGDAATEIACGGPFQSATGGQVSRIHARSVGGGASEVSLPLYVTTSGSGAVTLDVTYAPASMAPGHETCGTALDLVPNTPVDVEIVDAGLDLASACEPPMGELVYKFNLAAPADVDVHALSIDGDGYPAISLRDADCALLDDEVACHLAPSAHIFRHNLPAGDHYVAVSATAPTMLSLNVITSAPTLPPPDEDCTGTAALVPGQTVDVSFIDHQDDIALGCFGAAPDAAYELSLGVASDVLLVERISGGDIGAIHLAAPACEVPDLLACEIGGNSPVRVRKRNVAAGDYRVVAETNLGQPAQVTAFVRNYAPAVLVPFADACANAQVIPPGGGFFQGNTSNATADFSAGCDSGGGPANGAKDQLLVLSLDAPKRVVLDMQGSQYETLLDVRKGPSCPGTEVPLGCTVALGTQKSFLDLELDAGTYYIQIDGFGTDAGAWVLDVHVVDP
ncbi:MAG: hypothetical protein HOV80_07040 [Polyangiaceae bacterium]|nr:hypothetical protein [Polyangiaceae bacterium]